jgi:hypothetical protein
MSDYDQIANIMLGNINEVCASEKQIAQQNIANSYYNAYNVSESVLIQRRILRNYQLNQSDVNQFYKNPFFQMKDKRISYVGSPSVVNTKYMIVENISKGSLDVYRSCNSGWALTRHISDKNNCEELLNVIK